MWILLYLTYYIGLVSVTINIKHNKFRHTFQNTLNKETIEKAHGKTHNWALFVQHKPYIRNPDPDLSKSKSVPRSSGRGTEPNRCNVRNRWASKSKLVLSQHIIDGPVVRRVENRCRRNPQHYVVRLDVRMQNSNVPHHGQQLQSMINQHFQQSCYAAKQNL